MITLLHRVIYRVPNISSSSSTQTKLEYSLPISRTTPKSQSKFPTVRFNLENDTSSSRSPNLIRLCKRICQINNFHTRPSDQNAAIHVNGILLSPRDYLIHFYLIANSKTSKTPCLLSTNSTNLHPRPFYL